MADYIDRVQIGDGEIVDIHELATSEKAGLMSASDYARLHNGATLDIFSTGAAPGTSQYGAIMRLRGDGMPGVAGTQDSYWIGVDSYGNIYTGTQLNGAANITWSGNAANTSF